MRRVISFFFFWVLFATIILAMFVGTYWYWQVRKTPVTLTLETATLSGPRDPLIIRFSQTPRLDSLSGKIRIEPAQALRTEWDDHNRVLRIVPEENWPLETPFLLSVGTGQTVWLGTTPSARFRFKSPSYPQITEMFPADAAKEVVLGIEDPLKVTFDRSVKDYFIDFRLSPESEVVYQNNADKTTFEILPKVALAGGKSHTLSVYAKWRGEPDSAYHLIGQSSFVTQSPIRVLQTQDLAERAERAKQSTQAQRTDGKYIDINLKQQIMTLFENGRAIDAYVISSGKRGMDTPTGQFAVQNKSPRPWSRQYGLYMPYWQAITPDGKYGIHELPEWPGGYKEGANHLGTPVSHGCVRLGIGAAERVYAWSDIGTPIIIY